MLMSRPPGESFQTTRYDSYDHMVYHWFISKCGLHKFHFRNFMHLMAVNRLAKSAADWVLKLRCSDGSRDVESHWLTVEELVFQAEASLKSCML